MESSLAPPLMSKAGAVCGNSVRADLCGGWRGTSIPTATMNKAGRMIKPAGRWALGLGANEAVHTVFERFYENLVVSRQSGIAVNLKC